MQSWLWKLRYLAGIALIAVSAVIATYWRESLGHRGGSLFFIASIVCIGAAFGQNVALLCAVLAFSAYHFFLLAPGHPFALNPTDILALFTFLFVGMLVGGLSGRLSDRARAAAERSRELTALLSASKDLALAIEPEDALSRTILHFAKLDIAATVVLESDAAPPSKHSGLIAPGTTILPLRTANRRIGTISLEIGEPRAANSNAYIEAMLEIAAIAIERTQLLKEITQARVIGEREGLRTALLSSLSHDLRTPVATILASASTLADPRARHDESLRLDLAAAIQEEAERLNRYISNLLEMTRLQSGAIDVRRAPVDPSEIADSAMERMRGRFGERKIVKRIEERHQLIYADPVLLEQAFVNLIENAVDHAGANATIIVGVSQEDERVALFVEDDGPGVPADEQSLMFEKFFRGKNAKAKAGGVGLGLSVVRGIVEAFDGAVAVKSPVANDRGSMISMYFPVIANNEG